MRPTEEILAWHDCEIGVMFHYDMEVFDHSYHFGDSTVPDITAWDPTELDTDQWLRTARAAGAKYALLTAKHGTGFCLWPTKTQDYHVGNTKSGIDVVGSFIASCRKYGIKPGLYYSFHSDYQGQFFRREDGTVDEIAMQEVLMAQLRELLTNYGPLFELWLDGGVLRLEKGGPDVAALVNELQPDLICFGGMPGVKNVLRWSGSEQGYALQECWSTAHFKTEPDVEHVTSDTPGDPDDPLWAPAECDMPNRDVADSYFGGWMYKEDEEYFTYSAEYLFGRYLTSVGRNANLLLGALPDRRGLISDDQIRSFEGLGRLLEERLGKEIVPASVERDKDSVILRFDRFTEFDYAVIREDQTNGQNILGWVLETKWPDNWCAPGEEKWIPVANGLSVGHKRIVSGARNGGYAFRFRIVKGKEGAAVRDFRLY